VETKKIEQLQEKIDAYLEGQLSEEDKIAFEKMLSEDSELVAEVEEQKVINLGIAMHDLQEVKNELVEINEMVGQIKKKVKIDYDETETNPEKSAQIISLNSHRKKYFAAAAILVLLIIPIYFLFLQTPKTDRLFSQNFEPYPNVITHRGDDVQTDIYKAMGLYDRGQYEDGLQLFEKIRASSNADPRITLYTGICYLAESETDKAILLFQKVIKEGLVFNSEANWYLALSFVKNKQLQEAIPILENLVANPGGGYSKSAKKILHSIK
jgi:tetratricopeptide (TPR) repeat protein